MKEIIAIIFLIIGVCLSKFIPLELKYICGYVFGTVITLVLCLTDGED